MKYLENKAKNKVHIRLKMIWSMEKNIGHLLMEIKLFGMIPSIIVGVWDHQVIVDLANQAYTQLLMAVVPPIKT